MIDLYTYGTFNGRRASIMLEETGFEYTPHVVDLMKGEQKQPDFIKLNPSGRIPTIVDHQSAAGQPIVLSQSGAILLYLAEKSGRFLPNDTVSRAQVFEWLFYHATDIGPNLFNVFYFNTLCNPPQPEAAHLLEQRTLDHYALFDQHLANNEYLAGAEYTIADIAMFPAIALQKEDIFKQLSHIQRWISLLMTRPAVQRDMLIPE
ncbi:MAG TPA: glutathione S-transferase family protein [Crenotrichaceae bacterium]|nr:glutathione S-transferase family protein [Crenotrichaceae bacterium]